jgi:hypothetical protein
LDGGRDGFCQGNLLAGFSHLHASGVPVWAEAIVAAGRRYGARKGRPWACQIAGGSAVSQGLNFRK